MASDVLRAADERGKDLLAAEPSVAATIYFQHAGSELQRGINLIRLVTRLRFVQIENHFSSDRYFDAVGLSRVR